MPIDKAEYQYPMTLDNLIQRCFLQSVEKGFWDITPRNKGEMLALIHSEVSEVLEAVRKPDASEKIPDFTSEEEELADVLIRVCDYAGGHGLRLADAVRAKLDYNRNRPYKHGKNF